MGLVYYALYNQFKVNFSNGMGAAIPTLEGENIQPIIDDLIKDFIATANVIVSLPGIATGLLFYVDKGPMCPTLADLEPA